MEYLFFDFDGTLYDTVEGITKCVQYALRKRGIDAAPEELRCFAGPPLDEMFQQKFGLTPEDAEQAVRDFLLSLRQVGKKLGVSTSKPQVMAEELLAREGLLELFDVICGASGEGPGNAKWQVLQRAMDALGAKPEESLLVGDTKYDVAGAKRCGIPCVGVGYGYAAPGELEEAGAYAIVPDLNALRELLRGELSLES